MTQRPEMLVTLEEKIDPKRAAVVVVDMLNDFLDPKGKAAAVAGRPIGAARRVIPGIASLIASARAADVPVVYIAHATLPNHVGASGAWLEARSRATYSTEDICEDGTWGQEVITELAPEPTDIVVKKYRYGAFVGTPLNMILRSRGVETVICCGVSTNACVEATAREAFSLDYYVVYAADACASWDDELHSATLRTASGRYATVVDIADIDATWSASS